MGWWALLLLLLLFSACLEHTHAGRKASFFFLLLKKKLFFLLLPPESMFHARRRWKRKEREIGGRKNFWFCSFFFSLPCESPMSKNRRKMESVTNSTAENLILQYGIRRFSLSSFLSLSLFLRDTRSLLFLLQLLPTPPPRPPLPPLIVDKHFFLPPVTTHPWTPILFFFFTFPPRKYLFFLFYWFGSAGCLLEER